MTSPSSSFVEPTASPSQVAALPSPQLASQSSPQLASQSSTSQSTTLYSSPANSPNSGAQLASPSSSKSTILIANPPSAGIQLASPSAPQVDLGKILAMTGIQPSSSQMLTMANTPNAGSQPVHSASTLPSEGFSAALNSSDARVQQWVASSNPPPQLTQINFPNSASQLVTLSQPIYQSNFVAFPTGTGSVSQSQTNNIGGPTIFPPVQLVSKSPAFTAQNGMEM